MDQGTPKTRRGALETIYGRVKAREGFFLDPGHLRICGIQASQIEVSDGILQYQPCLFLPNQVNILEFPTDEVIPPLFPRPDFPSLLSEFEKVFSESVLEHTITAYDSEIKNFCSLDDWSGNAKDILCYIDAQLDARRVGLPHGVRAGENSTLRCWEEPPSSEQNHVKRANAFGLKDKTSHLRSLRIRVITFLLDSVHILITTFALPPPSIIMANKIAHILPTKA